MNCVKKEKEEKDLKYGFIGSNTSFGTLFYRKKHLNVRKSKVELRAWQSLV
jgi:hypothetical protein